MYVTTFFDENRDKGVAVPGLAQDVSDVIETGVVKDLGLELEYNMIEDGSIEGRPEDVFQALEYARKKSISTAKEAAQQLNNQPGAPAPWASVTPPAGEDA